MTHLHTPPCHAICIHMKLTHCPRDLPSLLSDHRVSGRIRTNQAAIRASESMFAQHQKEVREKQRVACSASFVSQQQPPTQCNLPFPIPSLPLQRHDTMRRRARQNAQEEALAEALAQQKNAEEARMREIQLICENDPTLRELQDKIKVRTTKHQLIHSNCSLTCVYCFCVPIRLHTSTRSVRIR